MCALLVFRISTAFSMHCKNAWNDMLLEGNTIGVLQLQDVGVRVTISQSDLKLSDILGFFCVAEDGLVSIKLLIYAFFSHTI